MEKDIFNNINKQTVKENRKNNRKLVVKTFLNHKFIVIGGVIILIFVILAIFADVIITHDPFRVDIANKFAKPSKDHLMGTDNFGRDIFSRLVLGSRIALKVGFISTGISTFIGSLLGLIAGYYGKWLGTIIMRIMDSIFSVPALILAIVFVSLMGPNLVNVFFAVSIIYIPIYARLVRSRVLALKRETYIDAERAMGQSDFKIIFFHIAPNLFNVIIVEATAVFAEAIIIEATLSFIGIGTPPPNPSWGSMLLEAKNYLLYHPTFVLFPGLAIMLAVLGLNLFGDGLRDVLDPRLSRTLL